MMTGHKQKTTDLQAWEFFNGQRQAAFCNTDRIFVFLLPLQWIFGIVLTMWISPRTWAGVSSSVHPHVWASVILGGGITIFPALLAWRQPGRIFTRHAVTVGQMLMGALLIHLTGGRIETHFHIFGSLAFLAFYKDWRVLVTATAVVLGDHFLRGLYWPQSIYGTMNAPVWRTLEHAGWVIFEDVFLILSIRQNLGAMRRVAIHQAELETINVNIEALILKRTEELALARDAALESTRLKSEFLANMSHEIRTPMNAVLGMSSLVLDGDDLTSQQREFITIVYNSAESLLTILNDILDFSRIESGKLSFEDEDFNLRETVEDTLEVLAESAQTKGLELVGLLQPGTSLQLRGDAGRLRQVLMNLLGNAIKFTEKGEVVTRVSELSRDAAGVKLRFEIQDTGIGISQEQESRLFEAFMQADGSTRRKYGGTGLGLVICKRIVGMMGGEIGVQSEPGQGSLFWFTAVLKLSSTPLALTPQARPGPIAGARALIVDDNITNILVLHHQLDAWGIKTRYVLNAEEALQLLVDETAAGQPFEIAILDMQMPGRDGLELARDIKANPAFEGMPVIMLTSLGMRLDPRVLREAGIRECLLKPVKQLRLLECLLRTLAVNSPGRESGEEAVKNTNAAAQAPPLRILLAEDNPVNQKVALFQLRKLGWNAQVASTGIEVLESLERQPCDIVLMDCQMPEVDGFEATRRIRRQESTAGIPEHRRIYIIALTAGAMEGDREKCLEAGMDDYLSKPLKLTSMAAAIKRFTDKTAHDQSLSTA